MPLVTSIQNDIITIDISKGSVIPCQDLDDYLSLLYTICVKNVLCSELYYLQQHEDNNTMIDNKNYERFKYQLRTINLFFIVDQLPDNESSSSSSLVNISIALKPFIMQETWPSIWKPSYIIHLSSLYHSTCQSSLQLTTNANITFIYITTLLLQTYKSYMANQNICNNHNEHAILDENNQFKCECKPGKDCSDEANFKKGSIFLLVTLIVAVIVAIITIIITSVSKIQKLLLVTKYKMS